MSKIKMKINFSVILIIIKICLVASQPSSVVISTQQQTKERYGQDQIQSHNKCVPISIPYVFIASHTFLHISSIVLPSPVSVCAKTSNTIEPSSRISSVILVRYVESYAKEFLGLL